MLSRLSFCSRPLWAKLSRELVTGEASAEGGQQELEEAGGHDNGFVRSGGCAEQRHPWAAWCLDRGDGFGLSHRQEIFDKKGEIKAISQKSLFRSDDFTEFLLSTPPVL